jgi:hypothetical protein
MKISEFFASGIIHKKARLLIDINLDNGERMKAGEIVSILKDYGDGYHAEHNDFACKVMYNEVELIK